ncbi:MAG: MerR family transcriptional regulator [Deltaproteobacteria bacterium]
MENLLKIGEFAKLTGVTVKTVLHYHKIGLLTEVPRTASGYRQYGFIELNRMRSIKRLKSLGLSLEQIKEVLGDHEDNKSYQAVLIALRDELQTQIDTLQSRVDRIQKLLRTDQADPNQETEEPPTLTMFVDILGEDAAEQYINSCPEMFELERKVYGVFDDLEWGVEYEDSFRMVAEYFRDNPEQYQQALDYGARVTQLGDIAPDSPKVDDLARSYSSFIKSLPFSKSLLNQESVASPLESIWSGMVSEIMTPAQMRLLELLGKYLTSDETAQPGEGTDDDR